MEGVDHGAIRFGTRRMLWTIFPLAKWTLDIFIVSRRPAKVHEYRLARSRPLNGCVLFTAQHRGDQQVWFRVIEGLGWHGIAQRMYSLPRGP